MLTVLLIDIDENADRAASVPIAVMVVPVDEMLVVVAVIPVAVVVAEVVVTRVPLAVMGPKRGGTRQNEEGRQGRQYCFPN